MESIQVEVGFDDHYRVPSYLLQLVARISPPAEYTGTLVLTSRIRSDSVFGGHFEQRQMSKYSRPVIIKFGEEKQIEKEGSFYGQMKQLQGTVVPILIAHYRTAGSEPLACLVLEKFGDSLEIPFLLLEREEKYVYLSRPFIVSADDVLRAVILHHLQKIHNTGGIVYDYFEEKHVLHERDQFRLIGFDDAHIANECIEKKSSLDFLAIDWKTGDYPDICRFLDFVAEEIHFFWNPSQCWSQPVSVSNVSLFLS